MTDKPLFNPSAKPTDKVEQHIPDEPDNKFMFKPDNTPEDYARHLADEQKDRVGLVPAWSPSRLKTFESCRWQLYLSAVLKWEYPSSPAAERGTQWHDACENFVNGTLGEWPDDMKAANKFMKFQAKFEHLRDEYADAKVDLEGEWGFDRDWSITDWRSKDTWGRMKLDALHWHTDTHATCIDYKTGRKFGNEVTHGDQGLIYTVGSFMRYPDLELLDVSFWYLDQGETSFPKRFTREQAMTFLPRITDRALTLTTAVEEDFKPSPSVYNCRWCPYNKDGDQSCEWRFIDK